MTELFFLKMRNKKIAKRDFLKSVGLLAIVGVLFPWFKKPKNTECKRVYPMEARKSPYSVPRPKNFC